MGCSSSVEMSPNRSGGYQGKAYPQQQQPQQVKVSKCVSISIINHFEFII